MQLAAALDAFLVQIDADGRSPLTIDQYRRHIGLLDRWLAASQHSREMAAIDHTVLARFLVDDVVRRRRDGQAKKATSTNTLRTSLRAFFAYVHAAGFVVENPARLVRRARCTPPPPRTLSDGEVQRLLDAVNTGTSPACRRDAALVALMLGTGLRVSSALALRVDDVDLARGQLRVRQAKNDAPIALPISRAVVRALRSYLRTITSDFLFPGESGEALTRRQAARRIEEIARAAGLRGRVSAHVLRHVFACRLLKATGGNLSLVQQALTHRSIASTTIYARIEAGALRAALRA